MQMPASNCQILATAKNEQTPAKFSASISIQ
jgi:hypothetical protein